jgi:hypothetical protein
MEKIRNAEEVRTVRKAIVKASEVKDMLKDRLLDNGTLPVEAKDSPNMGEEMKVKKPKAEKDSDRGKDQSIEMLGGENQPYIDE